MELVTPPPHFSLSLSRPLPLHSLSAAACGGVVVVEEVEEVVRGDMDGLRLPPLIEEVLDSTGLCRCRFSLLLLL